MPELHGDWLYGLLAFLVPMATYGCHHAWKRFKVRKFPGGGS